MSEVISGVLFLLLVLLVASCVVVNDSTPRLYDQKCEMCGAEFSVQSDDPVPPTIEWCFYDGAYCQDGFQMIIQAVKAEADPKQSKDFINHCLRCRGCRCAAFEPKDWHRLVDSIKRVRQQEGGGE